jgi:hypothetical protein
MPERFASEGADSMDIGVDTHKQQHILVALDARGQRGGSLSVLNTPEG